MATQVKHRRGTNAEIIAGTPALGELWFNIDDNTIHMGDGVTLGGVKHAKLSSVTLQSPNIASALARKDLKNGFFLSTQEDCGFWKVVLTTSVTPDGKKIRQCTELTDLSIVLADSAFINNLSLGGASTGPLNVVGCAVRITPQPEGVDNTFAFVDDTEHDPINCTGVTGRLNTIDVTHDKPAGSEVVGSTVVVPDETLAQRGIMCGGSIATGASIVTLTKRHQFKIDWEAGAADINDLIVDPFMDSTRYVATDNTGGNGAYRIIAPRTLDGFRLVNSQNRVSPDAYIADISDTTFDIFPYKTVTLRAKYDGANWVVSGNISALTTALTALGFTVTNAGNVIDVNHPNTLGSFSNATLSVKGVNDYFFANIFSESINKTQFVLVDDTGVPQVPVANDEFTITLQDILWKYGQSTVDIGIIKLSPTLDFKDLSISNNFWLLGNHWATK